MKHLKTLAMAAALVAASAANAATFKFSFDTAFGSGAGTFVTAGNGQTPTLITGLTGTFAGNVMALLPPGTYPLAGENNNLFSSTAPYFDYFGLSFSADGDYFNIYADNGVSYGCGFTNCDEISLTNLSISSVPEPESWSLLLIGFGIIGVGMRHRVKSAARG